MGGRTGAIAANILSVGARILGVLIYYGLRITYRPRERLIFFAALAGFIMVCLAIWWVAHA